jgi:glutamate--cysteine ligase catalytic subunit
VISYDHAGRNARLSLRQNEILEELANDEKLKTAGAVAPNLQHTVSYESYAEGPNSRMEDNPPLFHPEYGRYMLEATPGRPYGHDLVDCLQVEKDMKRR